MWRRYLRFWRPDPEADLDEEFRFHLETEVEELVAAGMTPERARAAALARFGDLDAARRAARRAPPGRAPHAPLVPPPAALRRRRGAHPRPRRGGQHRRVQRRQRRAPQPPRLPRPRPARAALAVDEGHAADHRVVPG